MTQASNIRDYQTQFEMLYNRVSGIPHTFLLSCFILGLKPHIRSEVQALQPINLMQAINLAKLQEEKFLEMYKYQRSSFTPTTNPSTITNSTIPTSLTLRYCLNPLKCASETTISLGTTRALAETIVLYM